MIYRSVWVTLVAFVLFVVLLVGGGLLVIRTRVAHESIRAYVERELSRSLRLSVHLGRLSWSWRPGYVELQQITISDPTDRSTFLVADRMRVGLRLTSLLRGRLWVRSIMLDRPLVTIEDTPYVRRVLTDIVSAVRSAGDSVKGAVPIRVEHGILSYRHPGSGISIEFDHIRGNLQQNVIEMEQFTMRAGTHLPAMTAEASHQGSADGRDECLDGTLRARMKNGLITVQDLLLTCGDNRLTIKGTADPDTGTLALTADMTIRDLGRGLPPVQVQGLSGSLQLSGRIDGTFSKPRLTGRLLARQLQFRGWHAELMEGPVHIEPFRIVAQELRLSSGDTAAMLSGQIALDDQWKDWRRWQEGVHLNLAVKLDGHIEDLPAARQGGDWPVTGAVMLHGTVTGRLTQLEGDGRLEVPMLRIGEEEVQSLRAALHVKDSRLMVSPLTMNWRRIPLRALGTIETNGRYAFTVVPLRLDFSTLPGLASLDVQGGVTLRLRGSELWTAPTIEGELGLSNLRAHERAIGSGTGYFRLDGAAWRWDLSLPQVLHANGVVPARLRGPFQLELKAIDLDVTPLLWGVSSPLPSPFMAFAEGTASLRGTLPELHDLVGRIDLTAFRGRAGSIPWYAQDPVRIALEAGAFRFESLDLVGSGLALNVRGSVRPGEQIDLTLVGSVPSRIVMPSVPVLDDLQGSPSGWLSLTGPPGDLSVTGVVDLAGIEARLKAVPIRLSITSGEMRFSNDSYDYKIQQGAIGNGRLEGTWAMRREGGGWRHTVDFSVDKARVDQLYTQLQWDTDWALGSLSTRGTVTFDTAPTLEPLQTLRGRVAVALRDGSFLRYPALVRIFGLLGSPAQLYRLPDLTRDRMPYRKLSAEFTIKDGIMDTQNLLLDSEVVWVSGAGKVNLGEASVDLNLGVRPLQVLERGIRKIPIFRWILPKRQSLVVTYFRMQGPWDNPAIRIESEKSLSRTLVDILLLPLRISERLLKLVR